MRERGGKGRKCKGRWRNVYFSCWRAMVFWILDAILLFLWLRGWYDEGSGVEGETGIFGHELT